MPRQNAFTAVVKPKVIAARRPQATSRTPKESINIKQTEKTASGANKTPRQIVAVTLLRENISGRRDIHDRPSAKVGGFFYL